MSLSNPPYYWPEGPFYPFVQKKERISSLNNEIGKIKTALRASCQQVFTKEGKHQWPFHYV